MTPADPSSGQAWTAQSALSRLLARLNYSDLSLLQAQQYLRRKGCPESLLEGTLQRCVELGVINDARMAEGLTDKAQRRGWSRQRLRQAEFQYGLQSTPDFDEHASCLELARRWHRSGVVPEKLAARLQRRGFHYSLVRRCMDELEATPESSD